MKWLIAALLMTTAPAFADSLEGVSVTTQTLTPGSPGEKLARIVFTVGNQRDASVNARVRCSLYDENGTPVGEAGSWVDAVPAAGEAVSETSTALPAAKADCRITDVAAP